MLRVVLSVDDDDSPSSCLDRNACSPVVMLLVISDRGSRYSGLLDVALSPIQIISMVNVINFIDCLRSSSVAVYRVRVILDL